MIPIFLSRPNPFTNKQLCFIYKFIDILRKHNFTSITLEAKDYNPYESLSCLNEMIKRTYGIVILAFGQVYINSGILKKDATNNPAFFDPLSQPLEKIWITSPFCQIEGSIAFNNNLPIFIISPKNIRKDGILKDGTHAIKAPCFSLSSENSFDKYFQSDDFLESFFMWKKKVNDLYIFTNNSKCI